MIYQGRLAYVSSAPDSSLSVWFEMIVRCDGVTQMHLNRIVFVVLLTATLAATVS